MIIDKTDPQFSDIPDALNGEVLQLRSQGFHTCTQESCYEIMTAGVEADVWPDNYNVSGLDINLLNKPDKVAVINTALSMVSDEAVQKMNLPQAIQNRIIGLEIAMGAANLDAAIILKWQLIVDINKI